MLKAEALACRRGARLIFRDAGFAIGAGGLLLVTGANGSGKSSLLRVLAGILPAAGGRVLWEGETVAKDIEAHRRRLNYIGHLDAAKSELTVGETLEHWRALRGAENLRDDPFDALAMKGKPVRYLSAGQKRRLALTRLAFDDAPLWLLDEPATALDREGQRILAAMIAGQRKRGGIVIAAMHEPLGLPDARDFVMGGA